MPNFPAFLNIPKYQTNDNFYAKETNEANSSSKDSKCLKVSLGVLELKK